MAADEAHNRLVAITAAHTFILQNLLTKLFLEMPKAQRLKYAEALLEGSVNSTTFPGVARDELHAMHLADMTIVTREIVDQMVGLALKQSEEVEGSRF